VGKIFETGGKRARRIGAAEVRLNSNRRGPWSTLLTLLVLPALVLAWQGRKQETP
jgi:hypothetical protein